MKLIDIREFREVDKRKVKGLPFKFKTCTHCSKQATREFVFSEDGALVFWKYCSECEPKLSDSLA